MKLAIIANPEKYSVREPFNRILTWAGEHEVQVSIGNGLSSLAEGDQTSVLNVEASEEKAINNGDVIVAVGGDGTMIYVAGLTKDIQKPILGINSGRLGFMANTQKENLEQALNLLKEGRYSLKKRHLLQADDSEGNRHYALNEFLFAKKDTTSMITVKAEYDEMFINNYWADGLIVASPTGSTAYNLSSEGPLVMPGSHVMVLTPVNPHTLTTRPLVLPSANPLRITIEEQKHDVSFAYDGTVCDFRHYPLEVTVQRSDYSIELVELPNQGYFDTLRHKLMWGVDYRERT